MNYFVYNGVSSLDMGLRIESKNVFSAPEYDVTFQSIPGRNGDLILPNGRYPNVQVTYSVFLPAKSIAELAEKITKVKAWLYVTGVMCAIADKKLSSAVGFKGICRKVLIFVLVGIGNLVDVYVLGEGGALRTAVIFFYLSNEGISFLENAGHLDLPIPEKLKDVLEQLHDKGGNDNESA